MANLWNFARNNFLCFWNDVSKVLFSVIVILTFRKCDFLIFSRGVVQLFNAVKKQQKVTEEKLTEAGSSVRKRDRVLQSISKGAFLDMLKGSQLKSVVRYCSISLMLACCVM